MTKYNINELLEKKKELEGQIVEKVQAVDCEELKYRKEVTIDHTREDRTSEYIPRPKQSVDKFTQEVYGLIDELVKVKTAIQKYNAQKVLGELQKREAIRIKHKYLTTIKDSIPENKEHTRKVTRQDKEGVALETTDITVEPMFDKKDVEKRLNEFASQERKINTGIQKQNLDAQIEL